MTAYAEKVAEILLDIGAVGFRPQSPVTFKSGILSPVYIDNRRLPYYPVRWRTVIEALRELSQTRSVSFDVIAGIEAAGIPHSAVFGYLTHTPSIFVRKAAKAHGKQRRVEGGDVQDKTVVLIEDLVTTGGSSLAGVQALREEGAVVTDCLAIVSYGLSEATDAFSTEQVNLHTLTTFETIWRIVKSRQSLDQGGVSAVEAWWRDPRQWKPPQ